MSLDVKTSPEVKTHTLRQYREALIDAILAHTELELLDPDKYDFREELRDLRGQLKAVDQLINKAKGQEGVGLPLVYLRETFKCGVVRVGEGDQ